MESLPDRKSDTSRLDSCRKAQQHETMKIWRKTECGKRSTEIENFPNPKRVTESNWHERVHPQFPQLTGLLNRFPRLFSFRNSFLSLPSFSAQNFPEGYVSIPSGCSRNMHAGNSRKIYYEIDFYCDSKKDDGSNWTVGKFESALERYEKGKSKSKAGELKAKIFRELGAFAKRTPSGLDASTTANWHCFTPQNQSVGFPRFWHRIY